jgi:hypothetical protein
MIDKNKLKVLFLRVTDTVIFGFVAFVISFIIHGFIFFNINNISDYG